MGFLCKQYFLFKKYLKNKFKTKTMNTLFQLGSRYLTGTNGPRSMSVQIYRFGDSGRGGATGSFYAKEFVS